MERKKGIGWQLVLTRWSNNHSKHMATAKASQHAGVKRSRQKKVQKKITSVNNNLFRINPAGFCTDLYILNCSAKWINQGTEDDGLVRAGIPSGYSCSLFRWKIAIKAEKIIMKRSCVRRASAAKESKIHVSSRSLSGIRKLLQFHKRIRRNRQVERIRENNMKCKFWSEQFVCESADRQFPMTDRGWL